MRISEAARRWLEYHRAHSQKKYGLVIPSHDQAVAEILR